MNKFENITELIARIIVRKGNKVLLCKNKEHGHYFLPGGHVEFGDSLEQTIYKEMDEELGLSKSDILNVSFNNYLEGSYLNKEEKHCELNMIFNAEIKDEIDIESKEDHIDFEWIGLDKISEVNLLPEGVKGFLKKIMNSKIFLSGGGDIKQTFELDEIFFNSLKKNSKILYIPIALNRDAKGFESCSDWFSEIIDLHSGDKNIDFTMFLEGESFPVLEEYEAIYIGGGNTFKLLDYLTRTGLKELLLNYLEGNHVIYGGSAGAIILGSSIGTVEEENDNNYIHYDGLNVVNEYSIICHYEPELDNNILSFSKENNLKIIALEEDAGLVIDGENVEAVGRVFVFKNGNKEPLKMLK